MVEELNFKQDLVAAFGKPIAENPTQAMIEAAFQHHGLNWRYLTIEVEPEGLGDAVRGARAMGFAGFNCTIPHKFAVIEHLDGLGESAALMGAVNCVVRRDGRLIGENTDGKGFVSSLRPLTDPAGKTVIMFGAGGAARAIGVELLNGPVRAESAAGMTADFVLWRGDFAVPAGSDVVINATSIGLYPDVDARLAVTPDSLLPRMIVADVIPNPPRTRLVRDARVRGCRVIDGLGMLVAQGVLGVEYWTGIAPDAAVMRRALEEVFGDG